MRVAVVDCGSGNIASVVRALGRAAELAGIVACIDVVVEPVGMGGADRVVLPGQGAFATCARGLEARGLWTALLRLLEEGRVPFLGVCVGMQLLAERGLERGTTPGLGWIRGDVAELPAPGLRLPHMGWNALELRAGTHTLLEGLRTGDHVYFVHSFALRGYLPDQVLATASYGGAFPAVVARGAAAGTQFHVEKSQEVGLRVLANFLRWAPAECGA